MKKNNLKLMLFEILEILLGAFISAISIAIFLLPNELSSGGFSGIATIIYYIFKIPIGITIFILNIPLFLFARFKLGKIFIMKSIIGTVSLSFFIEMLNDFNFVTNDKLLASIYGGVLAGIGTALILRAHSSTGGSDILGLIIREFNPKYETGKLITIIDFVIVTLNVIFLKKIEIGLYSAITIYLMGKMIDIFFEGIYFTKLLFIVSNKSEEISKQIGLDVKRGATGIYGKGMYTNKNKLVLMCAVSRNDIAKVKTIIKDIDPQAFLIVTNSTEVLGIGFKE